MKRGSIYLINLPESGGHEQHGARPAIIVSDPVANIIVCIPCTSNPEATRFPHTLLVEPSKQNGLSNTTVALIFQIRAIDRNRLMSKLGQLENQYMKVVSKSINKLLGS